MLRSVALVITDVSEELSASINSNRWCRLLVTADVPSSPILLTQMIEVLSSSETLVLTRTTRRNIPEDAILQGKCLFSQNLHGATSHKTAFFIVTVAKIVNPTNYCFIILLEWQKTHDKCNSSIFINTATRVHVSPLKFQTASSSRSLSGLDLPLLSLVQETLP
jgi:hypothetical protein